MTKRHIPLKALPVLLSLSLFLISCAGNRPAGLGVFDGKLSPCPSSPNCVCSDCGTTRHHIPPLILAATPQQNWQVVHDQVGALPRTRIVSVTDDYLHAECRSAVFGFVDDLELHLRPSEGIIAVRSAARLGHYDFGVNRRRVETLRVTLREQGIVQ